MMTSAQIRQSYLDFFKSKAHTLVPSSSLMPDSPNLLFTNAGMNQFVPIFLGERKADVSKWGGAIPGSDTRAADTQKCIRAGGKHNDLDDVGLDTYHHTFFEMLGNWSFGDYFKKEAIDWAWELVVGIWKFPPQRVYATIYNPDKSKGDPSERDEEAWGYWAEKFRAAGLDPAVHIVNGNKKDNFWMMGDTGPCGPCSELHIDLTPNGDTGGKLVNQGSPECIEIWNLVFIQFNANPDGTFSPLPAKHVDTGMGFERVTSIIQGTKEFADFANAKISNYETDIFRPIFDEIEKHSGKKYASTLPKPGSTGDTEQEKVDVAFRVIADHIRTLSFAVADGILPGNNDRNYVLRRILRRAVRYGRTLGFREPFFYKLVDVLARTMGDVFPEIRTKQQQVKDVLKLEEEAFNKTLDRGIEIFETRVRFQTEILPRAVQNLQESTFVRLTREDLKSLPDSFEAAIPTLERIWNRISKNIKELNDALLGSIDETGPVEGDIRFVFIGIGNEVRELLNDPANYGRFNSFVRDWNDRLVNFEHDVTAWLIDARRTAKELPPKFVFRLYDTFGFPLDLTELMARERGLTVNVAGFNGLMEEQRARARSAQKKTIIELAESMAGFEATKFVGYEKLEVETEFSGTRGPDYFATLATPFYAEMGGQVGDSGQLTAIAPNGESKVFRIVNTTKTPNGVFLHLIDKAETNLVLPGGPNEKCRVRLAVDAPRRGAIQRHHSVTHLLHWALHQVASQDASQKGSSVTPDKLTFDFNSAALTPSQVADIERLVNERILENAGVSWSEVPYADIKGRKDVMQFFGDKYGDVVRVVQIGGRTGQLDGYDMELCGGTHVRATGEIGQFRILSEGAVSAGVRRIEAVAGLPAFDKARNDESLIRALAGRLNSPLAELEKKVETLLAHQKDLEKALKAAAQREAAGRAKDLLSRVETVNGIPALLANLGEADGDTLQGIADAVKTSFQGVIVLGGHSGGAVALIAAVTPQFTARVQAGKLIQAIAPIVGGKGGGKPDNARGGGKDASKIDEALAKARSLLV